MPLARWTLLLLVAGAAHAQAPDTTAHAVPFAATGNTLALTVANTAAVETAAAGRSGARRSRALGAVTVALAEAPTWLALSPERVVLEGLGAGEEAVAAFTFDVNRAAPVGQPAEAVFEIRNGAGALLATKAVRLAVEAPRALTLAPASPNPFGTATGGRTRLAFELPEAGPVEVAVFDVLGRRVAVLVDEEREPGRHEVAWDAREAASGLYLVRLLAETAEGRRVAKVQPITHLR